MTNEAIRARMWEAYIAGRADDNPKLIVAFKEDHTFEEDFNQWLADKFPELTGDGIDGKLPYVPEPMYYHNFGCLAHHSIPNGEGICTCDGSDDPTKVINGNPNECPKCGFVLHNCVCSHADYEDD